MMLSPRFSMFLYGSLAATAVMIPRVLTTPLEQNTIVAPKAHVSAAPSVPVAARQNSVSDELNAMDDLDSNIFVASANDPQDPQARYREYKLQEDLLSCIQQYGVDPALIKDQSSIGTTSVKDVRFTQCQQALVQCTQKALDEHELSSQSWPIADPLERPVLRTNMLQRGMVKCLRVAASDTKKVFSLSDMTEEEFNAYGTVAMCNKHLVLCLEDISGFYDDKVAQWDEDHPQ